MTNPLLVNSNHWEKVAKLTRKYSDFSHHPEAFSQNKKGTEKPGSFFITVRIWSHRSNVLNHFYLPINIYVVAMDF